MADTLLDRLRAADGPDRALDWAIHIRDGLQGVGMYGAHPYFTSSLDIIRRWLIKPDWLWSVCVMEDGPFAQVIRPNPDGTYTGGHHSSHAATPELALLIAALEARGAGEKGNHSAKD